jgi:hypothetical protein
MSGRSKALSPAAPTAACQLPARRVRWVRVGDLRAFGARRRGPGCLRDVSRLRGRGRPGQQAGNAAEVPRPIHSVARLWRSGGRCRTPKAVRGYLEHGRDRIRVRDRPLGGRLPAALRGSTDSVRDAHWSGARRTPRLDGPTRQISHCGSLRDRPRWPGPSRNRHTCLIRASPNQVKQFPG